MYFCALLGFYSYKINAGHQSFDFAIPIAGLMGGDGLSDCVDDRDLCAAVGYGNDRLSATRIWGNATCGCLSADGNTDIFKRRAPEDADWRAEIELAVRTFGDSQDGIIYIKVPQCGGRCVGEVDLRPAAMLQPCDDKPLLAGQHTPDGFILVSRTTAPAVAGLIVVEKSSVAGAHPQRVVDVGHRRRLLTHLFAADGLPAVAAIGKEIKTMVGSGVKAAVGGGHAADFEAGKSRALPALSVVGADKHAGIAAARINLAVAGGKALYPIGAETVVGGAKRAASVGGTESAQHIGTRQYGIVVYENAAYFHGAHVAAGPIRPEIVGIEEVGAVRGGDQPIAPKGQSADGGIERGHIADVAVRPYVVTRSHCTVVKSQIHSAFIHGDAPQAGGIRYGGGVIPAVAVVGRVVDALSEGGSIECVLPRAEGLDAGQPARGGPVRTIIIGGEKTSTQCAHKQSVAKRIDGDARGFGQPGVATLPVLAIVGGAVASLQIGAGEDIVAVGGQIVGIIDGKAV